MHNTNLDSLFAKAPPATAPKDMMVVRSASKAADKSPVVSSLIAVVSSSLILYLPDIDDKCGGEDPQAGSDVLRQVVIPASPNRIGMYERGSEVEYASENRRN